GDGTGRGGARASAGSRDTGRDALEWMDEATRRGAGELLLTSIDSDGTGGGYDLNLIERTCARVQVPVVASGGAGGPGHMVQALLAGAEAALAASIFHDRRYQVADVKREAAAAGLPVRL
ncbi:MAG: HisA/HisF-related TIM barrel protein, partial [Gaiellales bacterium]